MGIYGRSGVIKQPATCEHCKFVRARYKASNPEGYRNEYYCGNPNYKDTPVYGWETCAYYMRDCLCYNQEGDQNGK